MEKLYDFKRRLSEVHRKNLRDFSKKPANNEYVLSDGLIIALPEDAGEVLLTAAEDFADYLLVSHRISARIAFSEKGDIVFSKIPCGNLTPQQKMFCIVETGNGITVKAYHERGFAQGLYKLEKIMNVRRAPYVKKGTEKYAPLFSPRMTHSAMAKVMFNDGYLSQIAHSGLDGIVICITGVNKSRVGYLDFQDLCRRAAKYGLDVYAYSNLKSDVYPADSGAEEYYDKVFGSVFKNCPQLAGLILVGETLRFPSRDPHTNGKLQLETASYEIPSDKPNPGWWPCEDYPLLVTRIRDSVRKYSPNADIIFWSYNWGYAPAEDRIKMINSLPEDISMLVTFEMFEKYAMKHGAGYCSDYTLAVAGPGKYYLSEAEAAAKRGIRLYAMTNTMGRTWDFGTAPYEPMPYQWIKRYEGLKQSHKDHNLSGILESHSFGLQPSIISDLANAVFSQPEKDCDKLLEQVLTEHFGDADIPFLKKALKLWSKAITHYIPSNENQYGAFRIGPAYPFNFDKMFMPEPQCEWAIVEGMIMPDYEFEYLDFSTPPMMRTADELKSIEKMKELLDRGVEILQQSESRDDNYLRLINLGKYLSHVTQSGINANKWHVLKTRIRSGTDKSEVLRLIGEARRLLEAECVNAEETLPIVRADSSLGFETDMDYIGDAAHIEWKLKQVKYVLDVELTEYEKRVNFNLF